MIRLELIILNKIKVLSLELDHQNKAILPIVKYIDNSLKGLLRTIKCHHVTCTQIDIDDKFYDIWSDDEALLADELVPTLYINDDLILFGNLIFATSNDEGATTGLSEEDIDSVFKFINRQAPKLSAWLDKRTKQHEYKS